MYKDLMMDIETLGTDSDAIVVSVGLVFFDRKTGGTGAEFYRKLRFQDQIDLNRKPSQSTIEWWLSQEADARTVFNEEGIDTVTCLRQISNFINQNCSELEVIPWGNGPSFDLSIMESLFNTFDIPIPWRFWNVRCLRTFKDFIYDGKDVERTGVYHNALDDCKHQIKVISKGISKI